MLSYHSRGSGEVFVRMSEHRHLFIHLLNIAYGERRMQYKKF